MNNNDHNYDFYSELLKRHIQHYGNDLILLIQNQGIYEILSNMNDSVNLSEISLFTSLHISKINIDKNIHSIQIPYTILQKILPIFLQYNYITVIINSRDYVNSHLEDNRLYEIHFPQESDIKNC